MTKMMSPTERNVLSQEEPPMDHDKKPSPFKIEDDEECDPSKDTDDDGLRSKVAKFGGRIVYNRDGSAYIIDSHDDESSLVANIPRLEGSIVDDDTNEGDQQEAEYPQIANAFYVSKSSAYYNTLYGQAYVKLMQEKNVPDTPVVHSYRVFTPRDEEQEQTQQPPRPPASPLVNYITVPVKPILMCFVCKLSFGCAETFETHCTDTHKLELNEDEKKLLEAKNSSAIIQLVGKDKRALVSFLEPVLSPAGAAVSKPPISPPGAILNTQLQLPQSKVPSIPSSSSPTNHVPASVASASLEQSQGSPLRRSPQSQNGSSSPPSTSPRLQSQQHQTSTSVSYPQLPTNANMLQGTTIGACPEHVNGRPTGVECVQCDLILNQSRMSGALSWNVSRNSCKTLKCPKCNWHYKYQETLEIHMKEKHPENETTCIYCITGQQHPRLARGETYTCGYKPYRCEVCNYSTTTKGNLSIHMQSDKHLNNMQDLQNGSLGATSSAANDNQKNPPTSISPAPILTTTSSSRGQLSTLPSPSTASPTKQKPNWRCDVCNYETNVARNLRIHMTSEKHTHNMMTMQQQNAKSMQQLLNPATAAMFGGLPTPPGVPGGFDPKQLFGGLFAAAAAAATSSGSQTPTSEQAAMADLAYNQALLAQIMSGGQFPGGPPPASLLPTPQSTAATSAPDLASIFAAAAAANSSANPPSPEDLMRTGSPMNQMSPPEVPQDPNPKDLLFCCVCRDFGCDNLDDMSQHLSVDRSRTRENEVSIVIAGNYLCQLCNYKTNLKANFQLHCKTDKHLQRLSHVNHIKEGGPANEWKLRFLANLNPVEIRCNACDFVTNSPHKLQVHFGTQQHQVSELLFNHLKKCEHKFENNPDNSLSYNCTLCSFSTTGKHLLMVHVRSIQHLQMEQMHQLKKRAEGNTGHTEIGDIFQVVENNNDQDNDKNNEATEESNSKSSVTCPLCQEGFSDQGQLEGHAMSVHSVNAEGLQRLQSLINGSHWLNKNSTSTNNNAVSKESASNRSSPVQQGESSEAGENNEGSGSKDSKEVSYSMEKYLDPNRPFKCDVCKESFTQKNILLVHYNSVSHLHKLKKSMQQHEQQEHEKTPTKGSTLEALLGNISSQRDDDDEAKPFKCNICKVAYTQGSTLDIHIRSVLHQTKASKLQELILSGQIDPSKPLIEQPDPQQLQEQHKKMINDMLSPKSVNSTGSTNNSNSSPPTNGDKVGGARSGSPQSSPLANLQQALLMSSKAGQNEDTASEDEGASNNLVKSLPFLPGLMSSLSPENLKCKSGNEPASVLKNLLQNYGLEVAKQFTEGQKSKPEKEENDLEEKGQTKSDQQQPASLTEIQEALQKAMLQAQLQQMNPMLMQMSQLQNLNPLVAMNLQPPLIPPALLGKTSGATSTDPLSQHQQSPFGMMDPKILALMAASQRQNENGPPDFKNFPLFPMDPKVAISTQMADSKLPFSQPPPVSTFAKAPPPPPSVPDPKALLMQQQPVTSQQQDTGKRARTRITDEQLKVLRSNFDINNSPTEEMLIRMAGQTGLPIKVIKHWFRNTLFKERQKNKDSPYNFNNPPSTKLNLEEYEKTGEPKVTPLNPEDQAEYVHESNKVKKEGCAEKFDVKTDLNVKSEPGKADSSSSPSISTTSAAVSLSSDIINASIANKVPKLINDSSSDNISNPPVSGLNLSHLFPPQLGHLPLPNSLLPNFPAFPNPAAAAAGKQGSSPLPPTTMPDYLNTLANSPRPASPQQSSGSTGKRANRTRFTDYQIKVLQEFFENNAYPKDDDLEYLSKLLGLSPRVIVVWFQNARQKARKIYENQPHPDGAASAGASVASNVGEDSNDSSGRFTKTAGCNYQCKKCLLVFQRYYELIRHQKQHCFKEEDAKRSAQAQKAAAQAAAQFSGNPSLLTSFTHSEDSNSSTGNADRRSITSPVINLPTAPDDKIASEAEARREMSKEAVNRMFGGSYPPTSPFGILQQQAFQQHFAQQQQQQHQQNHHSPQDMHGDSDDHVDTESIASSPSLKRKFSEDGDNDEHRDKRLRTTILPEQLDFLYQKYQQDSNPSRKMLEQIASEVGLRKRVVQVWFQNARAKERKGLSIHSGNNKATPDVENANQEFPLSGLNLQDSMRKYYEDTMKRFMSDMSDLNKGQQNQQQGDSALDLTSNYDDNSSDNFEELSDPNRSLDTESVNGGSGSGGKRFRTQMSGIQVKMMKGVFEMYKTPTMTECSSLGQEIGLQKRVVQVWFQNARAKEKRAKLQLQQASGGQHEPEGPPAPEECKVCQVKFSHKFAVQDHIFTKGHLDNLRDAIESGRFDPESPGHAMAQTAAMISAAATSPNSHSLAMANNNTNATNNRELLDTMASHQNPRMLMQV